MRQTLSVADEIGADGDGLGDSLGLSLLGIAEGNTEAAAIAQQFAETR